MKVAMRQLPSIPPVRLPRSIEKQTYRKSGRTYKTLQRKRKRKWRGWREGVSLQSVPKQNFSTATILSAGSVEVHYRALFTELILLLQKFQRGKENVTKKKWRGYCVLVWRNWKLCVFGIHVTALLKNASKQSQNSWDWVWAHKVVTIIQTSVVRMEGMLLLLLIVEGLKCATVPLNNKN